MNTAKDIQRSNQLGPAKKAKLVEDNARPSWAREICKTGREMNYVSLEKGLIHIEFSNDIEPYMFNSDEHERIGKMIAKHKAWTFQCSSSCDFPHESGFPRGFDVGKVLAKAIEYAREKVAITIEIGPIGGADERIVALIKAAKVSLPVSLKFVKSGKKGQDAILTFKEESDFEYFRAGLVYGARLAACTNSGACTNASASAIRNGASPAARPASTSESRRTSSAKDSGSLAGSVKRAGRSARTKKGSSPKRRRSKGG